MKKINFISIFLAGFSFLVIISFFTVFYLGFLDKNLESVSPVEFAENVVNNEDIILIDVRTSKEFSEGHLPGAVNIDYHSFDFKDAISEMDRKERYAIYCRSGRRSARVLSLMEDMGFRYVIDLSGGIDLLANVGEAVEYFEK